MIGIGGVSMSGLAEILKNKGYIVTGSDINKTHLTDTLIENNIPVFFNHDEKNVIGADAVIYTAAIKKDNPEYHYAEINNIPLIERSVLLGEVTKMFSNTIAIAGTHGKTTTTSMLSVAFLESNADPTISVGGELPAINSNYKIGNSDYFITEACEYVESFLTLSPHCAIILNIEEDHLDYYKDINHIKSSFNKFANKIDTDGYLVINNDDENCQDISSNATKITFGINNNSKFMAKNIDMNSEFTKFDFVEDGNKLATVKLIVPGKHNVYNALACLATCQIYKLPINKVIDALSTFTGAKRRFEFKGNKNGILIYDDYAHHPSEIKATLKAAKSKRKNKIWCVFQPHTYTRTKALLTEFSESFYDADNVIITDIYAAREKDTGEVSAKDLVDKISLTSKNAIYIKDFENIVSYLKENAENDDLVFTIGAGNVYKIGEELLIG
jgi:UDP-N-acetylmuramate--alanine ligase